MQRGIIDDFMPECIAVNQYGRTLIKHDEANPGKPACLLRDSGRESYWPAEGSMDWITEDG